VFAQETSSNILEFRTLKQGDHIAIETGIDEVKISAPATNIGSGAELLNESSTSELQFRTLVAGEGATISTGTDTVTISAPYIDAPHRIYHVAIDGSDTTGVGSNDRPFLTIQKVLDTIGSASTITEYNDTTQAYYIVKVHPGIYTENLTIPTRQVIVIQVQGVKIIGNITYAINVAVAQGTIKQSKLIIEGNDLRNAYNIADVPRASAIEGNAIFSTTGTGGVVFVLFQLVNAGVTGNISVAAGNSSAIVLQLFCLDAIVEGDFQVTAGSPGNSGTLYCALSDTSATHSFGGVLGSVILNILRHVRFTRPVIVSNTQSGARWFAVEFLNSPSNNFTGSTGSISADYNSFRSFINNVSSADRGAVTFTILDLLNGTTLQRPTAQLPTPVNDGFMYFDTDLGVGSKGRPIWRSDLSGTGWVDLSGTGWVDADGMDA
jgi:hypothetical protein